MKHTLAVVVMVFGLVCCATLTSDPNVPVAISFSDGSDGQCRLNNKRISFIANIPSTPMIRRSDDDLRYSCNTSDGRLVSGSMPSSIDALKAGGNVLLDLGITDALTDKARNYPSILVIQVPPITQERKAEIKLLAEQKIIDDKEKAAARKVTLAKLAIAKKERAARQKIQAANQEIEKKKKAERQKAQILAGLKQRCEEYGFTGDANISACVQREAQHDKELAMQKYELQKTRVALQHAQSQAQSRAYAQSLPPVVEEEEEMPWLIKFLGDVAIGVAEQYPAAVLEAQQKQDAYNRGVKKGRAQAKPNCGGPNCY